ncbi:TIGR03364 family FAD-dependent oxidoreductase [Actinocorallia sp. API 0066]|uniref:TIGR03364 family FAD-dependent oxidoreductase n=1 Tax=Actinocorallia sp. API 0066 TaxID=2896846 RepID=UPI001E291CFB|nr:TIGR03364 family FAD-dependent oxidoreductase [Actinocorallia sp. API 0066]MCD0449493.1 TIGR03364 family FAD-dependent oxidoreductase [Actinocorallia sp. API 0066]
MTSLRTFLDQADLVVVGAGIVGLAHAHAAAARGLSVAVVERNSRPLGASVRNFGHGCATAQDGAALRYAMRARETWLSLAEHGVQARATGTVVVARADDELQVLREFADLRGPEQVVLLDEKGTRDKVTLGEGVVGGAFLPLDVRVNPRQAAPAFAAALASLGVRFHWSTSAHVVEPGEVVTSRGVIKARHVVVAVGHDVDRHFPDLAADAAVQRCSLHMLRVSDPHGRVIDPAVLTGLSLLRYDGFAACPSLTDVRARMDQDSPRLVEAGLNLMFTQLPDGDLTVGDTHAYAGDVAPYRAEELDDLVLGETARLLGAPRLRVRERWRGVYASAPDPFLVAAPADGLRIVSVTSGIGMTTALGLAPEVLDDLIP